MKYKDWLSFWLENTVKPTTKPRTYARYREIAAAHIAPRVGEKELDELTPLALQSLVTELLHCGNRKTSDGLSANTVNTVVTVLQYSLKTAYDFGEVEEYFADRIKRPKATETDVSCFSLAEQRKIEKGFLFRGKGSLYRGNIR